MRSLLKTGRLFIAATHKREETQGTRPIFVSRYKQTKVSSTAVQSFSLVVEKWRKLFFAIGAHPILEGSARRTHQTGKRLDGHQTQHFHTITYLEQTSKNFFSVGAHEMPCTKIGDLSAWPSWALCKYLMALKKTTMLIFLRL